MKKLRTPPELFHSEREGFEPSIPVKVYMISSHALSTTQPPLQDLFHYIAFRWKFKRHLSLEAIRIRFVFEMPRPSSRMTLKASSGRPR